MPASSQSAIPQDERKFTYWVNQADRIVEVNQDWRDFAAENKAEKLTSDEVIGASIWGFICDIQTEHLYRAMLQKVRETGVSITVPFRCDAPDRRRFMQLTISRLNESVLELSSRILRQERREPVRLMAVSASRSAQTIVCCGWCKKIKLPSNAWVEVEDAIQKLNLFDAPLLPGITHGICPTCLKCTEEAAAL